MSATIRPVISLGDGWLIAPVAPEAAEVESATYRELDPEAGELHAISYVVRGDRVAGMVFGRRGDRLTAFYSQWDHEN